MFIITENIKGFNYFLQERKSKLYGYTEHVWNGLVDNAKKFTTKIEAITYKGKYNIIGEIKPVKDNG